MMLARASSEVDAANVALFHLGEPPLSTLDDDRNAARAIKARFATVRDATLCKHTWNFAMSSWRPSAELLPVDAADGMGRFPLPADCLHIVSIDGLEDGRWEIVAAADNGVGGVPIAKILACPLDAPLVRGIRSVPQVGLWSPLFLEVFGLYLAAAVARNVGKSPEPYLDAAEKELRPAKRRDAQEASRKHIRRDVSWLAARR